MDSSRFGRAVGVGVREVAKAAVKAAAAAQAPDPAAGRPAQTRAPRQVLTAKALQQGGKRFGQAAWSPVARASGVLWHEIIGVLFGMFALVTGAEAWQGRAALLDLPNSQRTSGPHEMLAVAMFLIFTLFTIAAFRRAARRQSRR